MTFAHSIYKAVLLTAAGLAIGSVAISAPIPQLSSVAAPASRAEQVAIQPGVPRLVQFNGTLKDSAARPVSGVASVTFAIYAEQDGGAALWSETQNVLADASGHFNVLLGAATSAGVPAELFGTGQSRWLGVTVARHEEMPRVLLASVPYALKAADAETLGGLPASAYVTEQSLAARTSSTTSILAPGGATTAATPQNSAAASSEAATHATLPISNATPTGSGTTNYVPLWTSGTVLGNSLLYQTGGKIGIGTTTPTETLDINGNSIFRGSFQLPPGHDAIASSGYESHSFQFQASSYNSGTAQSTTQSFGFRAEPLNNNTANPSGALDLFFIPNGGSTFINTGVSWSSTGIMTFAPGQTFSGASETLTGSLNLPNSTSATSGVIDLGGAPVLSNYGSGVFGNIFVGNAAGNFTMTGYANTAVGGNTLTADTSGNENVAVGTEALRSDTTGSSNIGIGAAALNEATSGGGNVALGTNALESLTTGIQNVAIGFGVGSSNVTGSNLTLLGYEADVIPEGLTNATAVGANSEVDENNTMVLGSIKGLNGASASVLVGIGTVSPQAPLDVFDTVGNGLVIFGQTSTPGAVAVDGQNIATSGLSNGGYFYSASPNGSGVVGENDTATGYAGYFVGNVHVTGTLSKAAGSFKIDDPIAPSEKYLSHSFVESPDMMNIYNGIVVLDGHGSAVVQMPDWFSALNRDFRYQLTAIGAPGPKLFIAEEISANQFRIAGGKAGMKVSWQVTGIRHDAYANAHRIPTEEEKPANEQGTYLHPELYGASPENGISALYGPAVPDNTAERKAPLPGAER